MKVLIIALPRTGSTSLMNRIAEEKKVRALFEPFHPKNSFDFSLDTKNLVVKTIVYQHPNNLELCKDFDEIILLSRKNLNEHIESVAFIYHNIPKGYHSGKHYKYSAPPQDTIDYARKQIDIMNTELENLSKQLNIPIQYYEDLFDTESPDRLRIKSKENKLL